MAQPVEVVNARAKLVSKLVAVMKAVDHVEKRGQNASQKYSYVKATDLMRAVRDAFIERGVLMLPSTVAEERWERPTHSGGVMNYCALVVEVTFYDSETGESLGPLRCSGWGQDMGDKAVYKAITGALKYALRGPFLIPDESDPENDSDSRGSRQGRLPKAEPSAATAKPAAQRTPTIGDGETREVEVAIFVCVKSEAKNGNKYLLVNYRVPEDNRDHSMSCWKKDLFPLVEAAAQKPKAKLRVRRKGKYLEIEDVLYRTHISDADSPTEQEEVTF